MISKYASIFSQCSIRQHLRLSITMCLAFAMFACATPPGSQAVAQASPQSSTHAATPAMAPGEDARVILGRKLFFDPGLSEPPGTSCASCHDPEHGYAGNHGSKLGVAQGSRSGHYAKRNTPSVMYMRFVRRFHLVWDEDAEHPEGFGGFFWDGRADTVAELVRQPLLNPNEMGNRDLHQIARKLERGPYARALQDEFDDVFANDERAVEALSFCIEAFLINPAMAPFSTLYDDFVRGRAQLDSQQRRGLTVFEDLDKGACSTCHRLDHRSQLPESSLFTDFGYDVVAVPRNLQLAANRPQRRLDLGLCERRDPRLHTDDPWYCGAFRTPSLRNVAKRERFMHNGVFASLREVVSFYATRATNPERW